MKKMSLLLATLAFSHTAFSHTVNFNDEALIETELAVSLSYSYRNKTYVAPTADWQIPGTLMGGEALPVDDDAALDDATADYRYALSRNNGFQLSAEAHGGHGETEFKFSHYWYMHQWRTDNSTLRLEAGKMFAAFTPHANWHASQDAYSEASLTGDILWGRSLVDKGIRASEQRGAWSYGVELWQGDSWLANNGHAGDLFARYDGQYHNLKYQLGAWLLSAEANERRDTRYFGGHSHGNVVVTSNDASFTGDILAGGIDGELEISIAHHNTLRLGLSLTQLEYDGLVQESQREASINSQYQSTQLEATWQNGRHQLSSRYENLTLDNTMTGAAAILVGRNTSLDNPDGIDPKRTTLSYRFQYSSNLTLRTEWIDESFGNIDQQRWLVGFVLHGIFN
ncbi:hypothetical protein [Zhongshania borealis]|uniref:Uncharacterized protein n=1 Tax=Zhongshania borealis TaxID=889488 RepID=A0ABP7WQQ4_9GAMM